MLQKLDWYIIGKFLRTFFFTVLIFSMVSLIIEFSEKIERFIESDITKLEITFQYFPTFLLFILGILWPMRMANNSEIISILNAGVSFWRFLRPYLVTAGFLSLIYLVGLNWVIPWGNSHRSYLERTYFGRNKDEGKTANVHLFVAPGTKVFMTHFSKRDSSARNFRIESFQDSKLTHLTKARNAKFVSGNDSVPDLWRLTNYEIRTFNGKEETIDVGGSRRTLDTVLKRPDDSGVDRAPPQTAGAGLG